MKLLVASGASGGHIYPALSFIDSFKLKFPQAEALLVLPKRSKDYNISASGCRIEYTSIVPIGFRPNRSNVKALINFIKGSFEILGILIKFKPGIVVGFGTIDCVPVILLAWLFRTRTLIHEQNVLPGRANKFLSKFADLTAVSFEETKDYLGINKQRVVFTGNPIRKELKKVDKKEALDFFGFNDDKFTILVAGGSKGSHKINVVFMQTLKLLPERKNLQVIHIAGTEDLNSLKASYNNLEVKVKLYSFFDKMSYAYSAADLALTRAGASTVSELINFRLAAVTVPYPFANAHQLKNAKHLEREGCAIIIEDQVFDAQQLKEVLSPIIDNPGIARKMRIKYDTMQIPDAGRALVEAVLSLN